MSTPQTYYYNKQLRRLIVQMMAIFSNMKVQVGWMNDVEPRLINVPIANSSKDKVVGWIKTNQTQNKPIRLPMFALTLVNLDLASDLRHGVAQSRRNSVLPVGGLIPDDIKVVRQYMPVPYRAKFELTLWASNQDQHYQIVEQIGTIFDPTIQIDTSDDVLDWARQTTVELTGINFEESIPAGAERRLIQTTFQFDVVAYLSAPADIKANFIKEIFIRVGAVSSTDTSSIEIIQELDDQSIPYDKIADGDDLGFN